MAEFNLINGELRQYKAALSTLYPASPRIYFVNGIRVSPKSHQATAMRISEIAERPVFGLYNRTAEEYLGVVGGAVDFAQCLADWHNAVTAKLLEKTAGAANKVLNEIVGFVSSKFGGKPADPINVAEAIRNAIPLDARVLYVETHLAKTNVAAASLFRHLRNGLEGRQWIVAHSQGNLITANALWGLAIAYGESSMANMKVYSLASPTPAWPLGIRGGRRKVYGHENDLVTFADPHNLLSMALPKGLIGGRGRTAGDWRSYEDNRPRIAGAHDVENNIALNFAARLREDLALPDKEPWIRNKTSTAAAR